MDNLPQVIAPNGEIIPPPRIGALNKQRGTRVELAKVYKAVRRGEIEPDVGSKLTYMLHTLSKVLETESLENRLERIEAMLEVRS